MTAILKWWTTPLEVDILGNRENWGWDNWEKIEASLLENHDGTVCHQKANIQSNQVFYFLISFT